MMILLRIVLQLRLVRNFLVVDDGGCTKVKRKTTTFLHFELFMLVEIIIKLNLKSKNFKPDVKILLYSLIAY